MYLEQFAEVWRQKLLVIALDGGVEAGGNEGRGVAEEVDVFVDLLDDFEGKFGDQGAVGDEEDGDFFVAVAYTANDVERGAFFKLRFAFEVPIEQDGGVAGIGGDEREAIFGRGGADDLVAFVADGFDETFHGSVGDGIGAADLTGNQQHPTLLAHPPLILLFRKAAHRPLEGFCRMANTSFYRELCFGSVSGRAGKVNQLCAG